MVNLDKLMKLHDAATPGPWEHEIDNAFDDPSSHVITPCVASFAKPDDAAYIVAACNSVPELVARIRELEDQVTFLNKVAGNLAYNPCLTCVDNGHSCPRELYSPDNDDIERVLVCCRMKHAWRDARIQMLVDKGKEFKGHPKCQTPETPCHARNGELCMSDNHLACAQAVNKKSLKQVSALEPGRIVSTNNSTPPEWIMHRFTEMK